VRADSGGADRDLPRYPFTSRRSTLRFGPSMDRGSQ